MTQYEPGTVAVLTLESGAKVRGFRTSDIGWRIASLGDFKYDREVTDVRPLVVLDPEDREVVNRFAAWTADGDYAEWRIKWVQGFLRSLTKPPKPAEPTGLGAVVEDAEGERWVRLGRDVTPWSQAGAFPQRWRDIDAVRVLSEGVQS